ncbi:CMGC/DYRK/DYRK2 protein kinase Pom1 [Schizosaccharomyces japonicus yFS275]|uniref:CMGC/DYRK/DYRK2 protein kinase Pom1 n=1 Tax=Schizosaccharomyces japonicus (strain yFS275 / FY16936) TaxID=402676 RepID=B6K2C4_SCHJY|nr:CMGC/DYRK/DYRK2 protein kinase Pom1 [Schizosaccharomyces japonicus yFS275]EEB07305.1 CMGC/DYRK/DYRK2 protein kinase Pom1 [Schizosaccharomyces japonicus yFS275]
MSQHSFNMRWDYNTKDVNDKLAGLRENVAQLRIGSYDKRFSIDSSITSQTTVTNSDENGSLGRRNSTNQFFSITPSSEKRYSSKLDKFMDASDSQQDTQAQSSFSSSFKNVSSSTTVPRAPLSSFRSIQSQKTTDTSRSQHSLSSSFTEQRSPFGTPKDGLSYVSNKTLRNNWPVSVNVNTYVNAQMNGVNALNGSVPVTPCKTTSAVPPVPNIPSEYTGSVPHSVGSRRVSADFRNQVKSASHSRRSSAAFNPSTPFSKENSGHADKNHNAAGHSISQKAHPSTRAQRHERRASRGKPSMEDSRPAKPAKEGRSSRGGFFSRLSFSRSSSRNRKAHKHQEENAPTVPVIPATYLKSKDSKELKDGKKTPTRTKSRMQQLFSWLKGSRSKQASTASNSPPPPVPVDTRVTTIRSHRATESNPNAKPAPAATATSPFKKSDIPPVPALPTALLKKDKPEQAYRSVSFGDNRKSTNAPATTTTAATTAATTTTTTTTSIPSLSVSPSISASTSFVEPFDRKVADLAMKAINSKRINKLLSEAKVMQSLLDRACKVLPVPSSDASLLNGATLTEFEDQEIQDYDCVFFTGTPGIDKTRPNEPYNNGFDDERGDYRVILGDHIAYRFEVIDFLGKGSFGQVLRCIDYKTGKLVALKIIRNKKRFHVQALVETKILQQIREWDPNDDCCMVRYTDHFYFRDHLCVATELLGMNLYELIKSNNFKGLPIVVIRSITKQILQCLLLLRTKHVIHCDLKPENILLCHPLKSQIKVIDFGSSCFENERVYTYIQSRFYRSPEVILGLGYGTPIDMWSLGCIIAEMFTGFPLFPGENEQEQLACIMEIFGPPELSLIEKCTRRKVFFDSAGKPRLVVSSKGKCRKPFTKSLYQALQCKDVSFLNFISACLRWDPNERMTPEEAMQHDFITGRQETQRPSTAPARQKLTKSSLSELPSRPLPNVPQDGTTSEAVQPLAGSIAVPKKPTFTHYTEASVPVSTGPAFDKF